jgi:transcriptional regulator with XRE-family HTH domain
MKLHFVKNCSILAVIMTAPLTGSELKHYRTKRGLSLEAFGELLGGKSATTIKRWEDGQEVPADTAMLLKWLIRGEVPFQEGAEPSDLRAAMLELEMQLGAFEKLYALAMAGGYNNVTYYIASLVQKHLAAEAAEPRTLNLEQRTSKEDGLAMVAETPVAYGVTGSKGAVQGPLQAAAKAFLSGPEGGGTGPRRTGRESTASGKPDAKPRGTLGGNR